MDTILLPPDFKDFLRLLGENRVEYLLIGGYAVGYHGYVRATGDMDIWLAVHPENAERVTTALRAFGFAGDDVSAEMFLDTNQILRMGNPPLRIELLMSISGVEFANCWQAREVVQFEGVSINIISLEDLKVNKKASGRLKDLNDLKSLS